jgi:hypothetical protein
MTHEHAKNNMDNTIRESIQPLSSEEARLVRGGEVGTVIVAGAIAGALAGALAAEYVPKIIGAARNYDRIWDDVVRGAKKGAGTY